MMHSLAFSKLVSTPTETAWSQAYNAGNLFAILSLSKSEDSEEQLGAIGKTVFSNLEAEFFTLEKKDLTGIKEAISKSLDSVPDGVSAHFLCAYFKDNILYIYIAGDGKIIMQRAGKTGVLLENKGDEEKLISASGVLKNNDLIILQTMRFAEDVSTQSLSDALDLDLPNDIAEALSPAMHEKDDGGQAAIIIKHKEPDVAPEEKSDEEPFGAITSESTISDTEDKTDTDEEVASDNLGESQKEEEVAEPEIHHYSENINPKTSFFSRFKPLTAMLKKNKLSGMNHRRKLFLTIAVILFIVLTSSVILARQRQDNQRVEALFESIYTPALKDYTDGKDIQSINKAFARDEFISARDKLKEGEGKFEEGSDEAAQITELLKKIEAELGVGSAVEKVEADEVELSSSELLNVAQENGNADGFASDGDTVYILTANAIVDASNDDEIIENSNDWESAVALASYQGNIYVLDRDEGIIKYTAGSDGFGQSSYFDSNPSSIKNARDLAIDGSIWILFEDGSIAQYTSGESDGYSVKGLATPFSSATKIFTNLDTESVYVLDNGNSRIVKLNKDGNFEEQYAADVIKNARAFEVRENEDRILLLSGDQLYEIEI